LALKKGLGEHFQFQNGSTKNGVSHVGSLILLWCTKIRPGNGKKFMRWEEVLERTGSRLCLLSNE
jgi:hypothetical protein